MVVRILASLIVGAIVGIGWMYIDRVRGAEWEVSPQQIADAKAQGKVGYESRPGTVAVLPIRSEKADILPFKWAIGGIVAAGLAFSALKRRKSA
ncbi:hypothetical protein [Microvirga rosea]|uniref:hypothetical protein n=1 Tax=Microvirga rosea TaxID=2715425 RepID=UPI001D0A9BD9|nr:hypothetical protein [Microvirga rosea]MCB8820567.1 hypothetical protein [Microvirga rosea]